MFSIFHSAITITATIALIVIFMAIGAILLVLAVFGAFYCAVHVGRSRHRRIVPTHLSEIMP